MLEGNADALNEQGFLFYLDGEYQEALRCLDHALLIHPTSAPVLKNKGLILFLQGRYENAQVYFDKALTHNPHVVVALLGKAVWRFYSKEEEKALAILSMVDDIIQHETDAVILAHWWIQFGDLCEAVFDHFRAVDAFNVALSLYPEFMYARKRLSEVVERINTPSIPSAPMLTGYSFIRPSAPMLSADASPEPSAPMLSEYSFQKYCFPRTVVSMPDEFNPFSIEATTLIESKENLGAGAFGTVKKWQWHLTDVCIIDVAVKRVNVNSANEVTMTAFNNEIKMLSALYSIFVVKMFGVTALAVEQNYGLVMECMDRGSLRKLLDHTPRDVLRPEVRFQMAVDIAEGIAYLHGRNPLIIHGDISSLNILLNSQGYAKLADFGLAAARAENTERYYTEAEQVQHKVRGALLWRAPELFKMRKRRTPSCDMYSYGVVLWELLTGDIPYNGIAMDEIVALKKAGVRESFGRNLLGMPSELQEISEQCWTPHEENRLSAEAALQTLKSSRMFGKNHTVRFLFPRSDVPVDRARDAAKEQQFSKRY